MSKNLAVFLACFAFIFIAFCDVGAFVDNARRGMMLFGQNVLPVLFPFFFVSSLIIETGLLQKRGSAASVVLMSYLSGYPTGARMIGQLYKRGEITRTGAIRLSTFTSTASPIFVIATVGTVLYNDTRLGVVIFVSHILGAMLNGVLYMRFRFADTRIKVTRTPHSAEAPDISDAVSRSLYSAVQNIFAVGGLIIIFYVAAAPFGVVGASVLEMTSGVFGVAGEPLGMVARAVITCAVISFGGLCVAMQGFVFQKEFAMPVWFYFLYKLTHAGFAAACILLLGRIFLF